VGKGRISCRLTYSAGWGSDPASLEGVITLTNRRRKTTVAPTTIQRLLPETCPLCGEIPAAPPPPAELPPGQTPHKLTAEAIFRAHLEQHRPAQVCRREHPEREPHVGWKLDLDAIAYYRADVSPWLCQPCGFHAPVG
jgi:hypothetical protein